MVPTNSELDLLRRAYGQDLVSALLEKRPAIQKAGSTLADVLNVPRSIMTSFDLSAPGRQGLMMVTQPEFWKSIRPMVKAFGDEKFYQAAHEEILSRPTYPLMQDAGLSITDIGALTPREEVFASNLADRIPIAGHIIRGSERAYTTFLNKLRADVFDRFVSNSEAAGIDVKDEAFLKSAAKWINTSTGRGHLPGVLQHAAPALNAVMFSPRLAWARIETFNPSYYASLAPAVRSAAIRANMSAAGAIASLIGLASMAPGVKVGLDPRSADWAKIRIGNTRIDLGGGHFQIVRAAAQLISGTSINSATGQVVRLEDNNSYRPLNRWEIIQRFLESKASPVASFVLTMLKGKTFAGAKPDLSQEVTSRLVPMIVQDTYDAIKEWGPAGAAVAPLGVAGVGVQTYDATAEAQKKSMVVALPDNMKAVIPAESAGRLAQQLQEAEVRATKRIMSIPSIGNIPTDKATKILNNMVKIERNRVLISWRRANSAEFADAIAHGQKQVDFVNTPKTAAHVEAARAVNRAKRTLNQATAAGADTTDAHDRLSTALQHLQQVHTAEEGPQ